MAQQNQTKTRLSCASLLVALVATQGAYALPLSPEEELGKLIFFDKTLSINENQSCASCHDPDAGWTGPLSDFNATGAVIEGSIAGRFGNRKPPSAAYATVSPIFHYFTQGTGFFVGGNFWDGRATGEKLGNPAADQAQGPFLNPLEQALGKSADVVQRICTGSYSDLFTQVWGYAVCDGSDIDVAYDKVALSIAAYEASSEVNAFSSKYDAVLAGNATLTRQEIRGQRLFQGKGRCSRCHTLQGTAPLFTDFTYNNLGLPRNPENPFYEQTDFNPDDFDWIDPGLGGFLETKDEYKKFASENRGKQKVPTLRNVDKRPNPGFVKAYGHNGYFKSLKGIVHFYNTRDVKPRCEDDFTTEAVALAQGCWPAPEVLENINTTDLGNLGLSRAEENAIVAFMKTLSDGWVSAGPADNNGNRNGNGNGNPGRGRGNR